jgi:hypothetical protein
VRQAEEFFVMDTTRDVFKSVPAKGAIVRNWTHATLTVDITNSIGETFHFEIKPGERSDNIPTRNTVSPADKGWKRDKSPYVLIILPIASA